LLSVIGHGQSDAAGVLAVGGVEQPGNAVEQFRGFPYQQAHVDYMADACRPADDLFFQDETRAQSDQGCGGKQGLEGGQ
jgi:hypothetical protein